MTTVSAKRREPAPTPLEDISRQLGAELVNARPGQTVSRLAGLAEAEPGDLSFLSNPSYQHLLTTTKAEAVIVAPGVNATGLTLLRVENPDLAFAKAAALILPPPPHPLPGIDPRAVVDPSARLGQDVSVGAGAVIEAGAVIADHCRIYPQAYVGVESEVGEGSVLYPRATLYHQVKLGKRCIIHAGAVIGADGFGYAWTGSEYFKIPQAGVVVLEDDVEIGANTCIDRARFGETRIGRGSKLDNLIQIAHNVRLGAFCAFAAQVGVAGSARIGNGVQIGGQTAVVGHITLGDRLTIVGQSGVTKSIPGAEAGVPEKDRVWIGTPAQPMREQLKEWQNLKGLARLRKKVREMAERLTGGEGNQT